MDSKSHIHNRKIIHIDMDAFFASVEQRDFPKYKGKPIAIGGDPDGRGVVATASYEARLYGVKSAMSCYQARKLCPELIFLRPRFDIYRQVSRDIQKIMGKLTESIEPLSLDEAYLDVTDNNSPIFKNSATLMAKWLKTEIYNQTHLTASAGVSFNKMLAKIASDINKPNGITIITPKEADNFIANLPIEKFHGVGKSSAKRFYNMGIHNGSELRETPLAQLIEAFGKRGKFYHDIAHGIDNRPIKSERKYKSIGSETTFHQNSSNHDQVLSQIYLQNEQAYQSLIKKKKIAHTITLKIKYSDFHQITRSHTLTTPFDSKESAHYWLKKLFLNTPHHLPIRLVGVTYSNLSDIDQNDKKQLGLFN